MNNTTLKFKNVLYNILDNGDIGNGWKYVEVVDKKGGFSLPKCLYYKGKSMKNLLEYSDYINHLDTGKGFINDFVKDIFRECYPGSTNPICKIKENVMMGGGDSDKGEGGEEFEINLTPDDAIPTNEEERTTVAPVEEAAGSVEESAAPVEEAAAPVEEAAGSVEESAAPVEESAAPVEEAAGPVEEAAVPAKVAPAEEGEGEEAAVPAEEGEGEEAAAPAEEGEGAATPTEETEAATGELCGIDQILKTIPSLPQEGLTQILGAALARAEKFTDSNGETPP